MSDRPGVPLESRQTAEGRRRVLGHPWVWLALLVMLMTIALTLEWTPRSLAVRATDVSAKRPGTHRVLILGRPAHALRAADKGLRERKGPKVNTLEVVDLRDDNASLADGLVLLERLGAQLLPDAVRIDLLVTNRLDPVWESQPHALRGVTNDQTPPAESAPSTEDRLVDTARRLADRCQLLRARCVVMMVQREQDDAEPRGAPHVDAAPLVGTGLTVMDLRALDEQSWRATVSAAADELLRPLSPSDGLHGSAPSDAADLAEEPEGAALSSLTRGSPPEERARLRGKLAELQSLRDEMKGVITELTQQRRVADELEARLGGLQRGMKPSAVAALLAEADQAFSEEASAPGGILDAARRIDRTRGRLLVPEVLLPGDNEDLGTLKREVAMQQEATRTLGTSTAVAFRALRTLGQLRHAVRLLEARQP